MPSVRAFRGSKQNRALSLSLSAVGSTVAELDPTRQPELEPTPELTSNPNAHMTTRRTLK